MILFICHFHLEAARALTLDLLCYLVRGYASNAGILDILQIVGIYL